MNILGINIIYYFKLQTSHLVFYVPFIIGDVVLENICLLYNLFKYQNIKLLNKNVLYNTNDKIINIVFFYNLISFLLIFHYEINILNKNDLQHKQLLWIRIFNNRNECSHNNTFNVQKNV